MSLRASCTVAALDGDSVRARISVRDKSPEQLAGERAALELELAQVTAELEAAQARALTQDADAWLDVGATVRLHSLSGRPELNGRGGRVTSSLSPKGRVGVRVDGVLRPMAVKPANLEEVTSGAPITVIIGTSALNSDDFVSEVSTMVNRAYGRCRLDDDDVIDRLAMGDAGEDANRVLHLAWRSGDVVGCCSSTLAVGWAVAMGAGCRASAHMPAARRM